MKKITAVILICVLAFALACCNNPEAKCGTGEAYGVTDGFCPVYAKVKSDGDGKVTEVEFREYLSIYDIGKLDYENDIGTKYGVKINDNIGSYARYVMIGDKMLEYKGEKYVFADDTAVEFDEYLTEDDGCKWYIEQVKKGNFNIVDAKGKSYGVKFNEYDGYRLKKEKWADKLENGYHEGVEYDSGYKENIYNLITHIKNHGFYEYTGKEVPSGKEKTFKVGRYDTLVKLENFHDYMQIAQKAYEKARNNVK